MSTLTLARVEGEITKLKAQQVNGNDEASAARQRVARMELEAIEKTLARATSEIETRTETLKATQAKLDARRAAKKRIQAQGDPVPAQLLYDINAYEAEIMLQLGDPSVGDEPLSSVNQELQRKRKRHGELGLLILRLQEQTRHLQPKVELLKLIANGTSEDDARRLMKLDEAEAARSEAAKQETVEFVVEEQKS